jgi:phage terminase small subunit
MTSMPVLDNPRHERFAQEVVKGFLHGQAYLNAGYKAKSLAVASAAATRLLKDVKIQKRIQEIQERVARKTEVTTESILAELEEARVLAMSLEQPNAAVAASMGKAKVAVKIVQRREHGQPGAFADLNDEELQQAILESTRELAEIDPDFAKQLAQRPRGRDQ